MLDFVTRGHAMKLANLVLLLTLFGLLFNIVRHRHDHDFLKTLTDQGKELEQTKAELQKTKHLLATAENKLGFLTKYKTAVQVTAFTGKGNFANGTETNQSYAVPKHVLPEGKVLSIALSPAARQNLHANMNDYILLFDKRQQKKVLTRFVDTTSPAELRSVVDVFFADADEARIFGRQHYFAVNVSSENSPFKQN